MEKAKIGENSGKVWRLLNEIKKASVHEVCRLTNLTMEEVILAIGWLARENNIFIERRENTLYISDGSEYYFCFG